LEVTTLIEEYLCSLPPDMDVGWCLRDLRPFAEVARTLVERPEEFRDPAKDALHALAKLLSVALLYADAEGRARLEPYRQLAFPHWQPPPGGPVPLGRRADSRLDDQREAAAVTRGRP
jgi:hypothetical protein